MTPLEMADKLRTVQYVLDRMPVSLIAFTVAEYADAVGRECDRVKGAQKLLAEVLAQLPDAEPLIPERQQEINRLLGAALDKLDALEDL